MNKNPGTFKCINVSEALEICLLWEGVEKTYHWFYPTYKLHDTVKVDDASLMFFSMFLCNTFRHYQSWEAVPEVIRFFHGV